MKKIKMILLLFLTLFTLSGQEYNVKNIHLIHKWQSGKSVDSLGTWYPGYEIGPNGPTGIGFNNVGNLIIYDNQNKEIKFYNRFLRYQNKMKVDKIDTNISIEPLIEKWFLISSLLVMCINNNENVQIILRNNISYMNRDISYYWFGNVLFLLENNLTASIPFPGPSPVENNRRILDEHATRALFIEPEKYGLQGVTLDNQNRFFVNGELDTRNYKTFYEYWTKKNNSESLKNENAEFTYDASIFYKRTDPKCAGKDIHGNVYWQSSNLILVFDNVGYLIDIFVPVDAKNKVKTSYAIHPSGDVYFLDYDKEGVYLYRVENVWDKTGRAFWYETNATVTAPNVRLRKKPSLTGEEAGYLQTDDRIVILETSAEKLKVGSMNAPWYRVKTKDGIDAWAYGGFIEKDE